MVCKTGMNIVHILLSIMIIFFRIDGMHSPSKKFKQHNISLILMPEKTYSLIDVPQNSEVHEHILAKLSGFCCKSNKIALIDNDLGSLSICKTVDGACYTPSELIQALENKTMREYPLAWHKKIKKLCRHTDTQLNIIYCYNGVSQKVSMPDVISKRLLRYLFHDITNSKRDSFDMCKKVMLEQAQPGEYTNQYGSLASYFDFMSKKYFVPGDMVGIGTIKKVDRYGYECTLQCKSYAIALGNNMFLFKLGAGGRLSVGNMKALKKCVNCSQYVKIHPSIGKRKDFLDDPFCTILLHNIIMKVCSQQVVSYTPDGHQVEWFVTTLDGFRCMHHQVKIRSRSTSGSIDLLTYNTSQELYDLLSTGKISGYILCDHKQLCYLSGDEVLNIWIDDRIVKFPCCIGKKLLLFLSHDSEDTNQCCFDLCFKVCLNSYNDSELLNKNVSYDDQWRHIGESELKPGDAVLLGTDTSGKHAAITLGNNMYLSKLGNGGALFVMTMKAMMNAYQCKNFVLIEPTITRYKKFWHDYKKNNFYNTSIRF